MKIVFMGTPDFSIPTLKALHQSDHELQAVVTQPDRPRGRGREMLPPPVKQYALQHGLPVHQPEKASVPEFVETLEQLAPDLIVVVAYGQILKENFLAVPRHFCMNVHASLLPKYRGAAPINRAIMNGDVESGVTTMRMDKGMDTGDICLMQTVPILPEDTAQQLHDALAEAGGPLALKTISEIEKGTLRFIPQDESEATYAPKLKKEEGRLNWNKDNVSLLNLIRGVQPWPGAYCFLRGRRLKINRAEIAEGSPGDRPGFVARVSDYGIEAGTGKGRLIIRELQPEGKKKMSAKSFLLGHGVQPGDRLDEEPS